jgi:acetyl esterase/lipase
MLRVETLPWGADAYADPSDQKHPYVSPLYGDYSKPFPPTLIQAGTREILLSDAVRHYQAIRAGGHIAILDVYEAMPHVFQAAFVNIPETCTAIKRAAQFFSETLISDYRDDKG